jgi:phosphohistidine phosphatase
MRLCLVRHGIAAERGTYEDDTQRPLTDRGRDRMGAAAEGLATLVQPTLILTSPLLRARETADLIARATGAPIEVCDALANGDHESLLAAAYAPMVVAVGHEPHISSFVSWAIGANHLPVEFKKGSAALVEFAGRPDAGAGALVWFMPPRALRQLRKSPVG